MRHSWKYDSPRKGLATCKKCGLEVKSYEVKKGNLDRCDAINSLKKQKKGLCQENPERHLDAMIAGSLICWNCGQLYTAAERLAGESIMNDLIERKISVSDFKQELRNQQHMDFIQQVLI